MGWLDCMLWQEKAVTRALALAREQLGEGCLIRLLQWRKELGSPVNSWNQAAT